jgi:hypothetical protein
MEFMISIAIFVIVLFLYVHIIAQYKRSEDLEIYEMDYINNKQLQEVCDIKQPVLFEFQSIDPTLFENINTKTFANSDINNDVIVKDTNDYYVDSIDKNQTSVDYIVLPYQSCSQLMKTDPASHFITENNHDFIEESGYSSTFQSLDTHLKPSMILQTKYDICAGSRGVSTALRYHTHFRHFLMVTSGKIKVKMTPWKSSKYLHPIKDYDSFEFRSPINVWKPQKKYANDVDKIRFLEFDVVAGYVLYIPPYWWYSIQYASNEDTIVCTTTYNSFINIMANTKDWVLYFIQQQNTHQKLLKSKDVEIKQIEIKEVEKENENNKIESSPLTPITPPPTQDVHALLEQLKYTTA